MDKRILKVELGTRSYPIQIGSGLLQPGSASRILGGRRALLLTDKNVAEHYLEPALQAFGLTNEQAMVLESGESQKSWDNAGRVLDWMLQSAIGRDAILIGLGGGVIGDLAGFCAALYQRGIDFVQVPTTLLAQVDSSVGGKTAVNSPRGKNLIGAFHQPIAVLTDTDTLKTLPPREIQAGVAEVIKYGMLADATLFAWLEDKIDSIIGLGDAVIAETIERCCSIKARIVGADERENLSGGERALLNLGHTFGHAIEAHVKYQGWLHGEAVAVGLCMAADLSQRHGWISRDERNRAFELVARSGLPTSPPARMVPADFQRLMGLDKKVKAGKLRLVLLRRLGQAELTADFDHALLDQTLAAFCEVSSDTAASGSPA